jgi:hypothetical protein
VKYFVIMYVGIFFVCECLEFSVKSCTKYVKLASYVMLVTVAMGKTFVINIFGTIRLFRYISVTRSINHYFFLLA